MKGKSSTKKVTQNPIEKKKINRSASQKKYSVPLDEQETVIQISRDAKTANIWTSDKTMITKLDKKFTAVANNIQQGQIYAKRYECPKTFISFRSKEKKMPPGFRPVFSLVPEVKLENDDGKMG